MITVHGPRSTVHARVAIFLCALGWCAAGARADEWRLEVDAGAHAREAVPVFFDSMPLATGDNEITLVREDSGVPVPVQLEPATRRLVWMLDSPLAAGELRHYRLSNRAAGAPRESANADASAGVVCKDDGRRLVVEVNSQPVLAYNHAVVPSPATDEPYYRRSGYVHPLYTPSGLQVTDDFAPDHMHQHGIMFPWTSGRFEGRAVNFWDQQARQGTVEHVDFEGTAQGPVFGEFTARLAHVDLSNPDQPKPALLERWHVRVYARSDAFLVDFVSTQECASASPLEIGQYHYGGFAIRGNRQWLQAGQGDFLTSEGGTRQNGNQTRVRWCDMHGLIGERPAGMAALCHPDNFRFPQPVRLHPDKPYFCFAPMVLGGFVIEPGVPYTSRYRWFVHDGPPDAARIETVWQDYSDPLEAVLVGRSGKDEG